MKGWFRRRAEKRKALAETRRQREWDMWMAFWDAMHKATRDNPR